MQRQRLTKQQARSYLRRYRAVNAVERAELRMTPPKMKLLQCAIMMGFARSLAHRPDPLRTRQVIATRSRWLHLGDKYRV